MIVVKIDTVQVNPIEGKVRTLLTTHVIANSIGGALNSIAPDPANLAQFLVTVVDRNASNPVYDGE
jgi:hypothetical protein